MTKGRYVGIVEIEFCADIPIGDMKDKIEGIEDIIEKSLRESVYPTARVETTFTDAWEVPDEKARGTE